MPAAGSVRDRPAWREPSARSPAVVPARPSGLLPLADCVRRFEPAHLGHLQVHQHHVERRGPSPTRRDATAFRPFSTAFTVWPRFLSSVVTSLRFTAIVFGHEHAQRRGAAARRFARRPAPCVRAVVATPKNRAERFEQIGVLDRLGQERIDAVAGGAAAERPTARPTSASRSVSSPARSSRFDAAREHEPVDVRHLAVRRSATSKGARRARRRRAAPTRADSASLTVVGLMCQLASISSRMRRFVALSSTTSTRSPSSARGFAMRRAPAAAASGRSKVAREEERAAAALRALDPEPSAHELDQAQGNRQAQSRAAVTPRRRAVGLGERLKDLPLFLRRNADAGVADGKVERHAIGARASER